MISQTKPKPDRADVCIIGAGASGATAAKVLTEAGLRVVALERGPWWKPEQFSADELANVHRYNLWPDPLINPRTFRASADEDPVVQLFCPVPQMVGGGTAHWTGWLPRMTENEFRPKTIYGEVPGANLADWPITYQELEPYYDKVEWAFGVSGQAGANKYEGPRSRGYPCPPLPPTRYNQKFHEGCAKLGYNSFPTPSAALSCPYNGWPATNQSAFAQQHGDPTGTRGNALTRFIPAALATGRYDLRPDCYVQEITVDAQGRARSAVYWDADGDTIEQEADLFILACGAIESARLLLLSRSSQFPNGLANGNDVVGRNATFHEYSAAIGAFEDPVYGVGRRRLCRRQHLRVHGARRGARFRRRVPRRLGRRRHPAADQLLAPGQTNLGAGRERRRPRVLQPHDGGRPRPPRSSPGDEPGRAG